MIDRRLFFVGAIVVALIVLSLIGLPPKVLWQKVQEFTSNATGAAVATRKQAEKREQKLDEVNQVLDSLPDAKKDDWAGRRRRNHP